VIYDVNRSSTVAQIMSTPVTNPVELMLAMAPLRFSVSVVSNTDSATTAMGETRLLAGEHTVVVNELDLSWPETVFSLSHIAIPFRPDDSLYGDGSSALSGMADSGVLLGMIAPRGERGMLALTPDYFLRLRYNPFYEYQAARIRAWLD